MPHLASSHTARQSSKDPEQSRARLIRPGHGTLLLLSFHSCIQENGVELVKVWIVTYEDTWPALRNLLSMSVTTHFVYVSTII